LFFSALSASGVPFSLSSTVKKPSALMLTPNPEKLKQRVTNYLQKAQIKAKQEN